MNIYQIRMRHSLIHYIEQEKFPLVDILKKMDLKEIKGFRY